MLKARSRLKKFDSFILIITKLISSQCGFSSLWDFAASEIWAVLRQDLNEENLRNDGPRRKFRQDTDAAIRDEAIHGQPIPLCASNSDAAKGMRLVVMLGIISRQIDKEIFQPSYFPSDSGYFRLSLNKLMKSDNEKGNFYRSVLSFNRDGQESELRSGAKSIVQNVSHSLYDLLSTTQYGELKERIKNVVDRAIEVWRPIQNSTRRFETQFDPAHQVLDENLLFQFPVGYEDQIGAAHQIDHILVIFPGLHCSETDTSILTSVVWLTDSQKLYVAANQQMREEFQGDAGACPTSQQPNLKRQNSLAEAKSQSTSGSSDGGDHLEAQVNKNT